MSRVLILTQGEEQIFESDVWAQLAPRYPAALAITNVPAGYPETMRWDQATQAFVPREQPLRPPRSGQINAASGTIHARPGTLLMIWASGAWGNVNTAQTVRLGYAGQVVASHAVRQAATTDRIGFSLMARVQASAAGEVSVTTTGGAVYDVRILWMEVEP
ncbi:MAG: hypothetical protein ACK4Z0_08925 [Sphingomonadaceae bacterium]